MKEGVSMSDVNVGYMIKHMNNLLTRRMEALFESKEYPFISYSGFRVLDYLSQYNDRTVSQRDIEMELKINRATTSKMLRQLEGKGLLARKCHPEDSRSKAVYLTEAGIELYNHHLDATRQFHTLLEQEMTPEDFLMFETLYQKICHALEK